jgi:quinol monooxygenase YgiN
MHEPISWQVELAVKPGELEHFRRLTAAMIEATRQESGVLVYERFVSEDGTVVYVYERYANSAAAVAHLRAFIQQFGSRFSNLVERRHFTVFGTPSAELKKILDGLGAIYLHPFGGFSAIQSPVSGSTVRPQPDP